MSSRQRRPNKGKNNDKEKDDDDDDKAEPIDEVLQSQQVQRLREEAYEQMDLFHNVFSRVCEGAMFLCLIMGISMGHQDVACWIHVVISVLLHFSAITIAKPIHGSKAAAGSDDHAGYQRFLPIIALLILVGVFVPHAMTTTSSTNNKNNNKNDDNDYLHHLGLAGSNGITMLVALYLKKDVQNTNQQIDELEKSKYHYKSL